MTHVSDPTKAHTPFTALLEIKGLDSPQDQAKRAALAKWVQAVNEHGGFGTWAWDVVVGVCGIASSPVRNHGLPGGPTNADQQHAQAKRDKDMPIGTQRGMLGQPWRVCHWELHDRHVTGHLLPRAA